MKSFTTLFTLLVLLSPTALALNENISESVVKITTTTTKKGEIYIESATGWAWQNPTTVITALHAVAGKKIINVTNHQGDKTKARIIKVVKQGDLALLKLDKSLDLVPLQTGDVNYNSSETFHVVGYPHGIPTMAADEIKFSKSFSGQPILDHLIKGSNLAGDLQTQGYPVPETQIYRLSSTIQPGHSGAPIVQGNGVVIGMADGGLKQGTARINWAIPTQQYVTQLSASKDTIPKTSSMQSDLFSAKILVSSVEDETPVATKPTSISDPSGQVTINNIWNASLAEILISLNEIDKNNVLGIFKGMPQENTAILLEYLRYDIYEDYDTGATFAVPEGAELTYEDGVFEVALGKFEFGFIPQNADNFNVARLTVQYFADGMLDDFPNAEVLIEDTEKEDIDNEYYVFAKFRVIQEEGQAKLFVVGGKARGDNAALLYFRGPHPESMSEDDKLRFTTLAVALKIISFASY